MELRFPQNAPSLQVLVLIPFCNPNEVQFKNSQFMYACSINTSEYILCVFFTSDLWLKKMPIYILAVKGKI